MYKVFFKESRFLLTDERNLLKTKEQIFIHHDFLQTKTFIIQKLNQPEKFSVILYAEDLEELFSIFKSCFLYVKAAGGVVQQNNRMLIIKRSGTPDLPKGHQEPGESIEQCAIREVEEECGLQNVKITSHLTDTLHIYYRNENRYLKKTYWYAMNCPANPDLSPQKEEDIEEVYWLPLPEISSILCNTYPSLRDVFEKVQINSSATF